MPDSSVKSLGASEYFGAGLLTEQNLKRLGDGFQRHYPIFDDTIFDDLIAKMYPVASWDGRAQR